MTPTENITVNLLPKPNENGMTLIELLVVLGILAALAGMTLSLVGEMNSSSRQDITKNKLDQIESAIIGNPTHYSRFLNDMGRLPVKVGDGDGKEFSELWNGKLFADAEDITFNYTGHNDNISTIFDKPISVTLNVGWKGAYLNVPNGKLYDGFGNNFWIAKNDDEELIDSPILKIFNPSNNIDIVPIINFGSRGEEVQKDSESNVLVNDKREINSSAVLATLHVKILLRDSSTDQMIWLPPSRTNDPKGYIKYDGQQHSQDDIVLPNKTETEDTCEANDLFICLPPTFSPTTSVSNWTRSQIVGTNGQYWRWLSHSHKLNRMRVVVFSPYVSPLATENSEEGINYKTSHVRVTTASYDSTDDIWKFTDKIEGTDENPFGINPQDINQKYINEVTIPNLVPGIRKIFVYGYVANDETTTHSNAHRSNVQTIEIKPGENFITIYLNEII